MPTFTTYTKAQLDAQRTADARTRFNWYSTARYGFFAHYVYGGTAGTFTINPDGSVPANLDALANGFNAAQFAADMHAFGAEYVIFTAWHASMNALYPSAVMNARRPGHASTRDVIADLIAALKPYGIRLMLYVHVTDGPDLTAGDQTTLGWNDATGGYATWNRFTTDLITELGTRYGTDVDGFWVDMVYAAPYADRIDGAALRKALLAGNPARVVVGNGGPDDGTPVSVGKGATDYMAREFTPAGGNVNDWAAGGDQAALVVAGNWWAAVPAGTNAARWDLYNLARFRVVQNTAARSGGVAYAAGPYAGSGQLWEDGVRELFTDLAALRAETVWVPALAWTGGGTFKPGGGGSRFPTWELNENADQQIQAGYAVPDHWAAFDAELYYVDNTTGSGQIKLNFATSQAAPGGDMTQGDLSITALYPISGLNILEKQTVAAGVPHVPGAIRHMRMYRYASDAADTGDAIEVIGVLLRRVQ